jgi:hypothetical protein
LNYIFIKLHFHHDKGDEMSKSPVVGDAFGCIFNHFS